MVIDPGGGNVVTVESLETIEDDIDRQLAAGREAAQDESAAAEFAEKHADAVATDTAGGDDRDVDADETDRETEHDVEYER